VFEEVESKKHRDYCVDNHRLDDLSRYPSDSTITKMIDFINNRSR